MTAARLNMVEISKRFGSTQALSEVSFTLAPGSVHAIVGENGAGKSTLIRILSGAEQADSGSMRLEGQPFAPRDPLAARRAGISTVYQELHLAPHLSVEANLLLGLEPSRWGFLRPRAARERAREALEFLGHANLDPDAPVESLSPAACQMIEIARALLNRCQILILDEPTSSLTGEDVERLFALIRKLRDRGVSIVYISHYLEEVERLADEITVLRDGRRVGHGAIRDLRRDQIVEMMVGRQLTEQYPRVPHEMGEVICDIRDLVGEPLPRAASVALHRGEILGIAGIIGSGRTEFLRAVYGLDAVRSGKIEVRGDARAAATARDRIRQGFGLLSEDRKNEGLALDQSIADNLTYSRMGVFGRWGWLNPRRQGQATAEWIGTLAVRCQGGDQPIEQLSGGNQQKVAFGRLLHQRADIFLLDEPTRGVDIGSKAEIYRLIGHLAAQGHAVLFVSSYLPELFGVCDRLAVMVRGRLSAPRPVSEWNPEHVMKMLTRPGEQPAT